jgi:hypothetical protein
LNPRVPVTLSAAYKTEGIRPSWPPRSRTELYRLIRAAPSTGWVAASGRWKCRSSRRLSLRGISRPVAAPAAHLPWFSEESGGLEPQRLYAQPLSGRRPRPWRVHSPLETALLPDVNRQEMEEDGRLERQRSRAHPLSRRGSPPGDVIFRGERATRTPRHYPRSR